MIYAVVIAWWAVGAASVMWLGRGKEVVWGDLLLVALVGLLGPVLLLCIVLLELVQADFWTRPVFPKKRN